MAIHAGVTAELLSHGWRRSAWGWGVAVALLLVHSAAHDATGLRRFYRDDYACRKVVPLIAHDVASDIRTHGGGRTVRLVAGNLFREDGLTFLRWLNRRHHLNVLERGLPVHQVRSAERNYFRIAPDRPGVELVYSKHPPERPDESLVYLVGNAQYADVAPWLVAGYRREGEWSVGNPGIMVIKYARR